MQYHVSCATNRGGGIFNPYLQTKKFEGDFLYIKKWVPEFQEFGYPKPMVDHAFARKRGPRNLFKGIKKGLRIFTETSAFDE